MPHLRFTRDRRGYENTYVVHSSRRRGRGGKVGERILYWFRSPPNVRVGRSAVDEDAIRALEEHNPDVTFDWTKILEAQPPPSAPGEPVPRRRLAGRADWPPKREGLPGRSAGPVEQPVSPGVPEAEEVPAGIVGGEAAGFDVASVDAGLGGELTEIEPPISVPVTVYHGGADVLITDASAQAPRGLPVEARLGSESLGRLRARFAEISARITERSGGDPVRLEDLRRGAEALNPDAWVTDEEIAAGLEQFDARLGEIRRALGVRRRRRSRRGGRHRRGSTPGGAGTVEATATREAQVGSPPGVAQELPDEDETDDSDENPTD